MARSLYRNLFKYKGDSNFKGSKVLSIVLAIGAALIVVSAFPILYAFSVYGLDFSAAFKEPVKNHLYLNAAANAIMIIWALRLTGRFDQKLASVISRAITLHSVMAFYLLTTRQFHSNQIMFTALAFSIVLGAVVISIKHRAIPAKLGLLERGHPLADQLNESYDLITDPAADLRQYDVLLTPSVSDLSPAWASALSQAMLIGKPVRHLAEFLEDTRGMVSLDHFDLEHLPPAGLTTYRTGKRVFDICLVLLSLPFVLPILAIGAIVLVLTMGRPVFFRQTRIGLGGKPFQIYKLRTMITSSLEQTAQATTRGSDPRITRTGYWLRRFRIDELPQLWNVLTGYMSVVGPRPEWDLLSKEYTKQIPVYSYRHLVRPGITGWAQVRGGYASDLSETRTKVGYDLFYIKNLTFALDVQILARTVWTLLSGAGAR